MAVNKPIGDNARKGAVSLGMDEARQIVRGVHGGQEASQREENRKEV